ncbi:esterase [Nostocales cyanobacterium HT-58-2]|nr:esterase [Nostocales cyanobacterium HT-58-2]
MNYFNFKIILLVSLLSVCSCHSIKNVYAQTPQMHPQNPASVLPPQPSVSDLATPLTYTTETYNSQVMGGSRTYGVALPPGYEQNLNQRYPVIFLLHGGHGNHKDWFEKKKGNALTVLEQLYAASKLPPSIVITPDGNDKRGSSRYWDPEYIDGPNGKVSTAVGEELVKVVQKRYRTLPNPDFWAIGGLSSGGWGAMNVGLHNLNHFSILFSHSGYFKDKSGPDNSPITYIKTISPQDKKRLKIYLDSGKEDIEELKEAQQFSEVLGQMKIYNMFRQFPGSHTWSYWRTHLADSLTFVGEQFKISQIAHAADNLGFDKP